MSSDHIPQHSITRRTFATQLGMATAGLAVGSGLMPTTAYGAARIQGANDRLVLASIGIRGQGNALKRGFARLKNVEIKTLCDVDGNLAPERINDDRLKDVASFKPQYEQDFRKVLADKDIDGVIIATPNQWHASMAVAALQAGKHVYVEKPSSYTIWEGRQEVEATKRYGKILQVGTMNRSRPAVRQAIKFLHDGGIGKLYMARGLCFKPRPGIGQYPDGPMQPGEKFKLNERAGSYEPTYDAAYLSKVNYDLWLGPAAARPFNRNHFHYNWHWHWQYGNGDTGNQGPHQFDIARWGLNKNEHPVKVTSVGGYYGPPSSQTTPDTQSATFVYPDGMILEFATRGQFTNPEGGVEIGNLFYGTDGWLMLDGNGRTWQSYMGPKSEKGPGSDAPPSEGGSDPNVLFSIESGHYQNFVDAIRANDPKLLTCDVMEGHLSSALPHLANIAYRVGHPLQFDAKTEKFVNDAEADKLLTRTYRKGYEFPSIGATTSTASAR